jgi:hypothetical protein
MATAEQIATQFPAFAHLVQIPEIKELLDRATAETEPWAADRFTLELQKTNWFRSNPESVRKTTALSLSDPAEYAKQRNEVVFRVQQIAGREGLTLSLSQIMFAAEAALRAGLDDEQIASNLIRSATSGDGSTGALDAVAGQVKQIAADYALPVADQMAFEVARKVRGQGLTIDGAKQHFANLAKASYQHLAPQIDAGFTVRDIAEPYLQTAGQLLEMSPDSMVLSDPRWSRALNERTSDGKTQLMSLGDWQKTLMSDAQYGWDRTSNAKATAYDIRDKLAETLGVR